MTNGEFDSGQLAVDSCGGARGRETQLSTVNCPLSTSSFVILSSLGFIIRHCADRLNLEEPAVDFRADLIQTRLNSIDEFMQPLADDFLDLRPRKLVVQSGK